MSTVSAFHRDDKGRKRDEPLHRPILDSVKFHKTPAFANSVKRAQRISGLEERDIRSMLNPPVVET